MQHSALLAPRFVGIVEFEGAAAIAAQQAVTASLTSPIRPAVPGFSSGNSLSGKGYRGPG